MEGSEHSLTFQVANAHHAEMARRANAEYEKAQAAKSRKAAPAMERSKTVKRKPLPANPQVKRPSQAITVAPTQDMMHQTSLLPERSAIAKMATMHSNAYLPKLETNYKPIASTMYTFIRDGKKPQTEQKAIYTAVPKVMTTNNDISADMNLSDQTLVNAAPIIQVTAPNCASTVSPPLYIPQYAL